MIQLLTVQYASDSDRQHAASLKQNIRFFTALTAALFYTQHKTSTYTTSLQTNNRNIRSKLMIRGTHAG